MITKRMVELTNTKGRLLYLDIDAIRSIEDYSNTIAVIRVEGVGYNYFARKLEPKAGERRTGVTPAQSIIRRIQEGHHG